jgi:hypothetical protein
MYVCMNVCVYVCLFVCVCVYNIHICSNFLREHIPLVHIIICRYVCMHTQAHTHLTVLCGKKDTYILLVHIYCMHVCIHVLVYVHLLCM